jgi:DNA-3-methyladenine glycosylase II
MFHDGRSPKLPFDPAEALAHLRGNDAKLGALIDRAGAFTLQLEPLPSPFASLVESILYQQLHGKAAATIHRRVREYFGGDPAPQPLLDTPDAPLRAAGVSGNKIKALRDLAARTLDGTVPTRAAIRKMSDEEIVERLTQVHGIGPWSVHMLLIFRMGRPDVLPVTDYGVRKGFALTFQRIPKTRPLAAEDLPQPEILLKRGKRWAPFRSVASWYLWRACDLAKATAAAKRSALQSSSIAGLAADNGESDVRK